MSERLRTGCIALVVAAAAAACETGEKSSEAERTTSSSEATTTAGAANVEVESSLEGMAMLPRRVRWIVTPSLPAERIREVRFLVHRHPIWMDSDPPYTYGEAGAYLVTSYFSSSYDPAARLRFTAQVIEWNGVKWRNTVVARVPEPQREPRTPDYGLFKRLSPADVRNPPPPRKIPEYTSSLRLLPGGLWVGRTVERAFAYQLSADKRALRVSTPIFFGSTDVAGIESGWHFKGYQCAVDGPPSIYAWSVQKGRYAGRFNGEDAYERYLVLEARKEPCERRRKILEGVWEQVD